MTSLTLRTRFYAPTTHLFASPRPAQLLAPHLHARSFAREAAPTKSASVPAIPASSSPSVTAGLPNSRLWRFRPTHRRFPLSNRHNPATPLRFRPVTPASSTATPAAAAPAAAAQAQPASIPFTISRTRSHALPVYLDYRGGGTLVTTCVRRVEGDAQAMARQLQLQVGEKTRVVVRPGRVEVKGNYVDETKRWLQTIGF